MQLTGAQALVRCLLAEQVGFVFGIASGKLTPLLHALSLTPEIRFVGLRHEASGAMMAAAVFAGTGRVAVALGEMAPGGVNLASGAGVAFNNHLPALLITTNQHRAAAYPHRGMFMDLDARAVFAPLTKWNAVAGDVRRLPELVRTAFRQALGGRPGPVHLDIPQDVLAGSAEFADDEFDLPPAHYRGMDGPRPGVDALAQATALLRAAQRPLIVAGGGVVSAGAAPLVRDLAARLQAPVLPTQMGLGTVASDSPHCIGQGGLIAGQAVRQAFAQADVVLSLGCRHASWLWDEHGPLLRRGQPHVQVNIDPAALGEPALHTVGMLADARAAAADLLAALDGHVADSAWLRTMRQARLADEALLAALAAEAAPVMHPAALAQAIGQALPPSALAVFDGGHTSFWSNDLTPVHAERTRFHDPGMCQLGFGLPYALALQLARPDRPVFNLTGDGSFGFTLQELDTARRLQLNVVTIIHNNAAWGVIRAGQRRQYDFEFGTGLEGSDYAAIARGFGCHGESVLQPADVAPAIARALASGLPAVLDCRTRFVPHPCMPAFGSMNRFGQAGAAPA
jgi:thiamine pyrophosphate-dependent acetolactate synthase large subunit-like protein